MPEKDESLYGPALSRIENKIDRMETENHTRFGNLELRLTIIENGQAVRKETSNRGWSAIMAFAFPTIGALTWLITMVTSHGWQIQQIDNFGSTYVRKMQETYEMRFRIIEQGKPKP
jgi:hypothetical protein